MISTSYDLSSNYFRLSVFHLNLFQTEKSRKIRKLTSVRFGERFLESRNWRKSIFEAPADFNFDRFNSFIQSGNTQVFPLCPPHDHILIYDYWQNLIDTGDKIL